MSLTSKLLSAGGGVDRLFSDDVFSAFTYTGNGGAQTINNGIDLAGKSGMVWVKSRSTATDHLLANSVDAFNYLSSNNTNGYVGSGINTIGLSSGFKYNSAEPLGNVNGTSYVSHTFRKAPKFFDIVTYTGDGVAGRQIPHALGIAPGMVVVKCTSTAGQWGVGHVGLPGGFSSGGNSLRLNTTDSALAVAYFPAVSTTTFTQDGNYNVSGQTYVAYLFAHDPSAD